MFDAARGHAEKVLKTGKAALIVNAAAAGAGDASEVERLLSLGARVDAREQGFTPLLASADSGHTDVCELLLRKGRANIEDITPDGSTALNIAAGEGFVSTVELLLSEGANVSTKDNEGFTPLLIAAKNGHAKVCELLLGTDKADVKETGPHGYTPLLAAASNGHTEVCELLIEKGKTNIEETWLGRGCTALIQAALRGHAKTVALLLSKGARPDARDQGFTPLLIAAQRGHTDVCELLLQRGRANIEDTTPDGSTALNMAAGEGFERTVELLQSQCVSEGGFFEVGFL